MSQWGSRIDFPRDGLMPGHVGLALKSFDYLAQLDMGICRQILKNPEQMLLHVATLQLDKLLQRTWPWDTNP